MTLKNSLSNNEDLQAAAPGRGISLVGLTAKIIKRHIWLPLLACLGFLMNMPVVTALVWSKLHADYFDYYDLGSVAEDLQRVFNYGSAAIIMVGAVLAAFVLFRYLHARKQVDFYHSLPIRREQFFAANMLAGLLVFLAPYLLAHLICLPMLAGSGLLPHMDMGLYVQVILFNTLAYLLMFTLAVMAIMLSGNLAGAVKILLATYLFCPAVAGVGMMMGGVFYENFYFNSMLEQILLKLSVIERYCLISFSDEFSTCWQDWVLAAALLVAAAAVCLLLYKNRRSECAGSTLAFRWQRPIFKYPYVLMAGLLGAGLFYVVGEGSLIWLAFGLLLGTLLAAQIMEIFITADFRSIKRNLGAAAVCVVLVAGIVGVYAADLTGYDSWQPEAGELAAIYLPSYAMEGFNYDWWDYRPVEESSGDNYYSISQQDYFSSPYLVTVKEPENVAAMLQILQSTPLNYGEYYGNEYGGYYDYNDSSYTPVLYQLKNGQYRARYVEHGGVYQNIDAYLTLYGSDELRAQIIGDLPSDCSVMFGILSDYTQPVYTELNPGNSYIYDAETGQRFWETYRAEFAELSAAQLIKELPVGMVELHIYQDFHQYEYGAADWHASWYARLPVYPEMTETVALLREVFDETAFQTELTGYSIVSVTEYLPKSLELTVHTGDEPSEDNEYNEPPELQEQTDAIYTDQAEPSVERYLVRELDVQADAAEIAQIYAETVAEQQFVRSDYYTPYDSCARLTYYGFVYQKPDGETVSTIRYRLPE